MLIGPNKPCWCGSGVKYKKCHQGRDNEPRIQVSEISKQMQKHQNKRECLHPDAGESSCRGKIVRAHTVRRTGGLSKIARDGHVIGLVGGFPELLKNRGHPTESLIGVKKASTFTGFCEFHDNQLFAPIEDYPLRYTSEQCALLGYRALTRELYAKRVMIRVLESGKELDRGKSIHGQIRHQEISNLMISACASGLRDIENHKVSFDIVLSEKRFDEIQYYALLFGRCPDILCSAYFTPSIDFEDQELHDLMDLEGELEGLGLSLLPTENGGVAIFTWPAKKDSTCELLVNSFHNIEDSDKPEALRRLVFEMTDNAYWSPSWWETLDVEIVASIRKRFAAGIHPDCIDQSLTDDGLRTVNWPIIGFQSNCIF